MTVPVGRLKVHTTEAVGQSTQVSVCVVGQNRGWRDVHRVPSILDVGERSEGSVPANEVGGV